MTIHGSGAHDRWRKSLLPPELEVERLREERDYWRRIAETVAPEHPVTAIPIAILNEISVRAERAEEVVVAARELMDAPNAGSEMRLRVALNRYEGPA